MAALTVHVSSSGDEMLVMPGGPVQCAVLVLAGSSGRVDEARAHVLASHGAAVLAVRWFGGAGQPPGICEVPLEQFTPALDRLAAIHGHLAVVGVSKGAEAALLLAARDPRVRFVGAFAPTHVVWANLGAGTDGRDRPYRSSFSAGGHGLPFVPYDNSWTPAPSSEPPVWRGLYEQSLVAHADRVADATIRVEDIPADVLLVAGGDDQVWPSTLSATHIQSQRARSGLKTHVVSSESAGHRTILPGEPATASGIAMTRGGSTFHDSELGNRAMPVLLEGLGIQV